MKYWTINEANLTQEQKEDIEDARKEYFNLVTEYLENEVYPKQEELDSGAIFYECKLELVNEAVCEVSLTGNEFK